MYRITSSGNTINGQTLTMDRTIVLPPAKGKLPVTSLHKSKLKLSTFRLSKAILLHLGQKVA